jgi:hypothetical protein
MHFSIVMAPPAFWLVGQVMLSRFQAKWQPVGVRQTRRNNKLAGVKRPAGRLPKISVSRWPVTISQAMKVTKRSTHCGDFAVSEQAEQTSAEAGSSGAEPIVAHSSDISTEPTAVSAEAPVDVESPALVPEQGAGAAPEVSVPKADSAKVEAPKIEAFKAEPSQHEPRMPGNVMIMSSANRGWDHEETGAAEESEPGQSMFGKRRLAALAAVVALAAIAGAVGGAMATVGLQQFAGHDAALAANAVPSSNAAFDATVARIDADIAALKAGVEHTSKLGLAQFSKTNDRLDKVEKAELEPLAKLAKLSEQVEKLHATPPAPVAAAAPPPPAPKEVTGSITPQAATAATGPKVADVKSEVGRLPTIEGWILRDVANGGALIEGRQGIFEVYAGDLVPGLGRIDAVRRQDGHWVVVTSRGLVVAR